MTPRVRRVLETALYVDDLERSRSFYQTVLGLQPLVEDQRLVAMDGGGGTVLLLFLRGASKDDGGDDQGAIPGHDGSGRVHFAFAVDADELDAWDNHLTDLGVEIESRRRWPRGGTSLYFRDPDGHLVELATPGIWTTY
ncbi:MAG: VOC family protein [Longimicrobiales bacterium]|nr:VOC family protein [Longimicrobiales bacterium]